MNMIKMSVGIRDKILVINSTNVVNMLNINMKGRNVINTTSMIRGTVMLTVNTTKDTKANTRSIRKKSTKRNIKNDLLFALSNVHVVFGQTCLSKQYKLKSN